MKHTIQLLFCTKDKVTLIFLKMVITEINSMFFPHYVKDIFVLKPAWLLLQDRPVLPLAHIFLGEDGSEVLVHLSVASEKDLCP